MKCLQKAETEEVDLAKKVVETIKSEPSEFKPIYNVNLPIKEKD